MLCDFINMWQTLRGGYLRTRMDRTEPRISGFENWAITFRVDFINPFMRYAKLFCSTPSFYNLKRGCQYEMSTLLQLRLLLLSTATLLTLFADDNYILEWDGQIGYWFLTWQTSSRGSPSGWPILDSRLMNLRWKFACSIVKINTQSK